MYDERTRITITLKRSEWAILVQLAQDNLRTPGNQARYILRQVLLGNDPGASSDTGCADPVSGFCDLKHD